MNELLVAEVIVRLNAIRALLPETPMVSDSYVAHFRDAIRLLENALGRDLARFGITAAELRSRRADDVPEGHCDRELLTARIGETIQLIQSWTRDSRVGTRPETSNSRRS